MSLSDTDKNNDNRNQPKLNVSDLLAKSARMAHGTSGTSLSDAGATNSVIMDTRDGAIILRNTADNTQVGMGIIPGTTDKFGFFTTDANGVVVQTTINGITKIAKNGVSALTATDEQQIFNSTRNTLQVHGGIFTAKIPAVNYGTGPHDDTVEVDISSLNLTQTPMILAFYRTGSAAASLGDDPWGGSTINLIDASAPARIRAFTILMSNHSPTRARFTRRFINCSAGETLQASEHNIAFIVCTQRAS